MKIILAGGPDSGKTGLAVHVSSHFTKTKAQLAVTTGIPAQPVDAALGSLADYRTELFLASFRAHSSSSGVLPVIHKTSLLDSMAYSAMRLAGMTLRPVVVDEEVERWQLVMATVTMFLRDSFDADLVFYLPRKSKGMDSFEDGVSAFLPDILDGLGQEYISLDGTLTENVETVARMIGDVAALSH